MKILITTDWFATDTNGVVTSVKNLWDELKKSGHDVRILTLSENMKSHREGEVYYIRSMPIGVYPDVRVPTSYRHKLIKELIDWAPDVIHSQCEFFSFQFALHISRLTKAPIVHTYHTLYEHYVTYLIPSERLGKYIVRVFSKKRLKRVEVIVVPTKKVEDTLLGYGMKNKMLVVPSGINLEQHKKRISREERAMKRKAWGISEEQSVLINLGRLGTEKNLEELLSFFPSALAEEEDMAFLIVGDGPAKDQLKKQADELGIADKVIFTGMVEPSEAQDYYQLGDVFVSASTSETQGLTYIEAAANGLPLVCRQDPCLDDVISEGENGYTYTDKRGFLDAVQTLMRDPERRKRAGKRSEEIALTFDKSVFGATIRKIYESVVQ